MQPYDIVSKLWIEQCTEPFLKILLGARIKQLEPIEEVAQEQPSISRADYGIKATTPAGTKHVFVLEFLTRWETDKLIDFARYGLFCKKKFHLRIRPVLVLFNAHAQARPCYKDECTVYRFRLLKLYELDAAKLFARRIPELYPLIPLMRGGVALAGEVNRALIESTLAGGKKADLLVVLRVFLGLRDKAVALKVKQEQDACMNVMAESPMYQEILQQGEAIGLAKGEAKGRAEGEAIGLAKGEVKGRAEGLREALELGLELRFGAEGQKLRLMVGRCSLAQLERAMEAIRTVQSLEELERALGVRNHQVKPSRQARRER